MRFEAKVDRLQLLLATRMWAVWIAVDDVGGHLVLLAALAVKGVHPLDLFSRRGLQGI